MTSPTNRSPLGPSTVSPAAILSRSQTGDAVRRLAAKIKQPTDDRGTPYAKIRIGFVAAVDTTAWTCTAYISDMTTPIPNVPILDEVNATGNEQGVFTQVGDELTLIGMLSRGSSSTRVRKQVDQVRTNVSVIGPDDELKFYGQSGRSYLVELGLVVTQDNSATGADFKLGFSLPFGASWTGGGPGADPAFTHPANPSPVAIGAGNWQAVAGAAGATLSFGMNGNPGQTTLILVNASIRMDATPGIVSFAWAQNVATGVGTLVKAGSWLKSDITSEITV